MVPYASEADYHERLKTDKGVADHVRVRALQKQDRAYVAEQAKAMIAARGR